MNAKHIIFVHGLFGWGPEEMGGYPYFGEGISAMEQQLRRNDCLDVEVQSVSCGPVSSFHDRACEVYAQIVGCKVDYNGKLGLHSSQAGHGDSGKDYSGKALVANWSDKNPVILIGHSAGAHTCLQLQQLLADKFWGDDSHADWVEAIVCISGVINGSTLPYMLGCDKRSGLLAGSVGNFIGSGVQILGGLNRGWARNLFDWDLEHWVGSASTDLTQLLQRLQNSQFAKGKDNLAYDLTLQGCKEANERFKTHNNSYYLSVVTEQTVGIGRSQREMPGLFMNPVLSAGALYQSALVDFDADSKPIENWGSGDLTIDKWRANDGAVSSISQRYPFTGGNHPVGSEGFMDKTLNKGNWYYQKVESISGKRMDHLDVVFGYKTDPRLGDAHRLLYTRICDRLCSL